LLLGLITYQYVKNLNLFHFRGFYSGNGKLHKKVDFGVGRPLALPVIDRRLSEVEELNP